MTINRPAKQVLLGLLLEACATIFTSWQRCSHTPLSLLSLDHCVKGLGHAGEVIASPPARGGRPSDGVQRLKGLDGSRRVREKLRIFF